MSEPGFELTALDGDEGEVAVEKRCAWCGVVGTVLTWRLMAYAVSSPLEQSTWFPTMPVREAKVSCRSCENTSYGLLVFGYRDDRGRLNGHFVVLPLDRTAIW
ncbi:hypothetical protein [Micromonospora sp. RV43]|uniref:hypothetical protein n=1 Tax=Micromonospora sp. RV43 TaxID=1661387 RepID=UPI00064C4A17|nr:hypothetical protein [Micromonospora sp. RV43]